jgi:ATP-dependent Clp protease protease subunit
VASAGALIYSAADRENRYSLPNTRFLLHQPMGGVRGQAQDIAIEAEEIIKMRERLNRIFSEQTGQPLEKVSKDTDRNFWMGAQQAIEYGLVGKIVTSIDDIN